MKWSAVVWFVCVLATVLAMVMGRQAPPSREAAMLHLGACDPPCWIGIVPEQTTVTEALQRIRQVYEGDPHYTLEYKPMPNLSVFVMDKASGSRLEITLNIWGTDWTKADPVVDSIGFYFDATRLHLPLLLGDLNAALGSPNEVIAYRVEPMLLLSYQTGRIHVFVPSAVCNRAGMSQEVLDFMFYGQTLIQQDHFGTENPVPWRGFNVCHPPDNNAP